MLDGIGITVANSVAAQKLSDLQFALQVRFLEEMRLKRFCGVIGVDFYERIHCIPPDVLLSRDEHGGECGHEPSVGDLLAG